MQVEHPVGEDVLARVSDLRVLAGPDEVAFVNDPSVDTGNATQMARVARARVTGSLRARELHRRAGGCAGARARGRREPPKLLEMARAVVDYDEDLPPVDLRFEPIDLRGLAPAGRTMYRAAAPASRATSSTPVRRRWATGRCGRERSRQIHVALYGAEPAARIDFCPRVVGGPDGRTLMKCSSSAASAATASAWWCRGGRRLTRCARRCGSCAGDGLRASLVDPGDRRAVRR